MIRTTRTYAVLDVPHAMHRFVREKLLISGYDHALHEQEDGSVLIDMHGIALKAEGPPEGCTFVSKRGERCGMRPTSPIHGPEDQGPTLRHEYRSPMDPQPADRPPSVLLAGEPAPSGALADLTIAMHDAKVIGLKAKVYDAQEAYKHSMNGATATALAEAKRRLQDALPSPPPRPESA